MSTAERIETMDNISRIVKQKNEIRSKARAVVPNLAARIDETTQRVKDVLKKINEESSNAEVSED